MKRIVRLSLLVGVAGWPFAATALECPAMPQQSQRDWDVAVAMAVGRLGDVRTTQVQTQTRTVTSDLLKQLPNADRVYLEQMMYATYCSSLRDNTTLTEVERNARIRAYNAELRATLHGSPRPAPPVDPRDAARAELARVPVDYTTSGFLESARNGKTAVIRSFLQAGFDANATDANGVTALMHAAGVDDVAMIEALLRARADVNKRNARGGTALSWAASAGRLAAMRLLVKAGADHASLDGALPVAVRSGNLDAVRFLIDRGANARLDEAETMRSLSLVRDRDPQRLGRLLDLLRQQGVAVDAVTVDGWSGLTWAAYDPNPALIDLFVRAGADVNRHCACPGFLNGDFTALAMATLKGSEEAVGLLVDAGARVDEPTNGATVLMLAAQEGTPRMVELLLSRGADPNKARNRDGETALMQAVGRDPEVLSLLLAAGADVDDHSTSGLTALMWAAFANQPKAAEILIDAGAHLEDKTTPRGRTALMLAALNGNVEAAQVLVKRGARLDAVDNDNMTALAHAAAGAEDETRTRMVRLLTRKASP